MKLADLGIDHNPSVRGRREAPEPEKVIEQYIAEANKLGEDITAQGLLRLERRMTVQRRPPKSPVGSADNASANGHGLHGDPCQAKREDAVPVSSYGVPEMVVPARDVIAELKEHQNLLQRILEPFCRGEVGALKLHERRLMLRLLADIRVLVDLLEQNWSDRDNG